MEGGLLSLKWNNHKSTFFHVLSNVRKKDQYSDATIACDGKFYKVHKLVLSTCSEYFEEMFALTDGKSPIIVLKDIKGDELESLLSYMYIGEVNVVQDKLAGLIKAAECLRIKGLAVPDEDPMPSRPSHREKRSIDNSVSSDAKRRKEDSRPSSNSYQNRNSSSEEIVKPSEPVKHRNSVLSPTRQITISDNIEPINNHNEESSSVKEEMNEIAPSLPEIEQVEEPQDIVKQEPSDDIDAVFIEDSNSVPENKDMMNDMNISDSQQHFMDELLGQNSEHGNMSAASEFDETESSAGPSQQQMVPMRADTFFPLTTPYLGECLIPSVVGASESVHLNTSTGRSNKAYICPYCNKCFGHKNDWRKHVAVHTGHRPHKCSYCDQSFIQKGSLKSHLFRVHNTMLEKKS